jgi:hypothetical protein
MEHLTNTIQNSILAKAPKTVIHAIKEASQRTGVNFAYLVRQAHAESGFKPDIKARTSSATGLYQFIESTWMGMVEKYGDKYGIETDGKSRREILDMRRDPKAASFMAAEFASENEKFLNANWGGKVGDTELYFAHFLGPAQASSFLKARDENPSAPAALLFPDAARANKNVFYDVAEGRMRSVEEVYGFFDGKFSDKNLQVAVNDAATASSPVVRRPAAGQITSSEALMSIYGDTSASSIGRALGRQAMAANAVEIMLMAEMDSPLSQRQPEDDKLFGNSLYNQ